MYIRSLASATVCFCASVLLATAQAVERVETRHPRRDFVLAESVLQPTEGDRTADIQQAIDAVHRGGGGTVFLKAGVYRVEGALRLRMGVVLEGDYAAARAKESTLLSITGGQGDEEGTAAVTMEAGSGLRGLFFHYPNQRLSEPVPYPWTVRVDGGNNQTIEDCTFVNSWRGFVAGPKFNECHTLRRVRLTALKTAIHVDMITDIGRLTDVTVSPSVWADSRLPDAPSRTAMAAYLRSHESVAIDLARSDWEYMRRIHVDGYHVGFRFRKIQTVPMNGVLAASTVKDCDIALDADELNDVGLSCYDCAISGTASTLKCSPRMRSIVQFHSCRLSGGAIELERHAAVSLRRCDVKSELVPNGGKVLRESEDDAPFAESELIRIREPGWPHPFTREFLSVADYGASPTLDDNAPAFNAALKAAAKKSMTVYVPAGFYSFRSGIVVPSGVELRGVSSVPHHTMSGGSVLMIRCGKGEENGEPFCTLMRGAGLKGIGFWYPEQPVTTPVPYPWCVQSRGEECYLVNVNMGNAWKGADFASFASTGHFVSYLSGGFYKAGLHVGKSQGGYVEDMQLNPHYIMRRPHNLPFVQGDVKGRGDGEAVFRVQRENLRALVFRDCVNERVTGTFHFAAYEGISFEGKSKVDVLIHGSDTTCRCSVSRLAADGCVRMALGQFVPLGHEKVESAVYLDAEDKGRSCYYSSQIWPKFPAMLNCGKGYGLMDQYNSTRDGVVTRSGVSEEHLGYVNHEWIKNK